MEDVHLVPFEAATLTSKVGLEALVTPITSRRWGRMAPGNTIAALLSHYEVPSTTPLSELVEIILAMYVHPRNMRTFL